VILPTFSFTGCVLEIRFFEANEKKTIYITLHKILAMKYVGLQKQISSNTFKSILLLIGFPMILLLATYAGFYFLGGQKDSYGNVYHDIDVINANYIHYIPYVLIGTGIWFVIAFFGQSAMIKFASGSHTLERKTNMRVYNLTENLCIGVGMKMPQLQIIESNALNAFASGLTESNYTVTLTRGIIEALDDRELEGVIAHELMHIRNKDVRLLVISLIFVGIFSLIIQLVFRNLIYGMMFSGNRKNDKDSGGGAAVIIVLVISIVAYFLSLMFKLALSRKREFMADAGAAQMTKNPMALASALRKISGNSDVKNVKSDDVKEMFIDNPPKQESMGLMGGLGNLFSTHPPIDKRIQVLEQI